MTTLALTGGEMAVLAGDGSPVSRGALALPTLDERAVGEALAALYTRSLLTLGGDPEVEIIGAAVVIAAALGGTTDVLTVASASRVQASALHVVCSPAAALVVVPQALGCFEVDLVDPGTSAGDLVRRLALSLLTPEAMVAVQRRTGAEEAGLAIYTDGNGSLLVADVPVPDASSPRTVKTQEEVAIAIDALLVGVPDVDASLFAV